jgi:DMSO/TMAO reductase YedYZ molybdopterin-dependent catalytic subunit
MIALLALCCSAGIAAPATSQVTTAVTVAGNVAQPLSLTVADLKHYPARDFEYAPPPGADHKSSGEPPRHYTGCLLRDILAAAKPIENKPRELRRSYVVATASDGYEVVFSWAELFVSPIGDNVFVVYERDGAPLPDDEGRIALIVITDHRPVRHVKWLQTLALRAA